MIERDPMGRETLFSDMCGSYPITVHEHDGECFACIWGEDCLLVEISGENAGWAG